jgi:hypothetical protein
MKNINIKGLFALILVLSLGLSACYEESNWLADNAVLTGNHFPIVQNTSVEADSYAVGENVEVTCHYWSIDEVEKLELYASVDGGDASLYSTTPYTHNYDPETRTDVATLDYVVPEGSAGAVITLRVVVVNANGLSSAEEEVTQNNGFDVVSFAVSE